MSYSVDVSATKVQSKARSRPSGLFFCLVNPPAHDNPVHKSLRDRVADAGSSDDSGFALTFQAPISREGDGQSAWLTFHRKEVKARRRAGFLGLGGGLVEAEALSTKLVQWNIDRLPGRGLREVAVTDFNREGSFLRPILCAITFTSTARLLYSGRRGR
jgi:hypothetical protein